MMERRFRVFEDSPVHFSEVVRLDQTAEIVGENITVVAVSFPQPLFFKELTCSVNEELLQHRVGERNHAIAFLGLGRALDDLRSFALGFDVRRLFLHTLQCTPDAEFLRCKVNVAPFERTQLA